MQKTKYRKGERVRFKLGVSIRQGRIKEDRGPIGIKGRHLYLIEFPADPGSPSLVELPATEFTVVGQITSPR